MLAAVIWLLFAACPGVARGWTPPTIEERTLVERALDCYRARKHNRDPFLLLELLRLETHPEVSAPDEYRGTILAVACHESGYSPRAVGDYGLALGLTQLHYYHRIGKRSCNLDPDVPRRRVRRKSTVPDSLHPIGNALCWLYRVRQAADHFARRGCETPWKSGWGWIATGRRCCGCYSTRHLEYWEKFSGRSHQRKRGPAWLMSTTGAGSDEP